MMDIDFSTLLNLQVFVSNIDALFQNHSRFWSQYVAPFGYSEIDDIFDSEGRGSWDPLDPVYAAQKARTHPGKGILRREDAYYRAATGPNRPGSIYEVSPTELVIGVRGSSIEHAQYHEEGTENLSARPVYELIAAGERFEQRLGQLGEKYQEEAITAAGGRTR